MAKIIGVDFSHILYKNFYEVVGNKSASQITKRDMDQAYELAIKEINKYRYRLKNNVTVIALDDQKNSWRTQYTQDNDLPRYKSTRTQKKSLRDQRIQKKFNKFRIQAVKDISKDKRYTVVGGKGLEADDILAGLANNKSNRDVLYTVTSDKDLTQLTSRANSFVYNNRTGRRMTSRDVEFDQFVRSVRGRSSYNIPSAYPRIRTNTLREIFYDEGLLDEFLEQDVVGSDGVTRNVGDMVKHNEALFDVLDGQPNHIKKQVSQLLTEKLNK